MAGGEQPDQRVNVELSEQQQNQRFAWLRNLILKRIWYVHPGVHLRLSLPPDQIYHILHTAAKPSSKRLHLRNVFRRGRRYFLFIRSQTSFQMMTTHKVFWHPRRRTQASSVLIGTFEQVDDTATWLVLRSRIRIPYLVWFLFWPTFLTSMLIFMTWPLWVIVFFICALYVLSWLVHRYTAAIEAYEMIYFIEKVLDDFIWKQSEALPAKSPDILVEHDFASAWNKFVHENQDE